MMAWVCRKHQACLCSVGLEGFSDILDRKFSKAWDKAGRLPPDELAERREELLSNYVLEHLHKLNSHVLNPACASVT